MNKDSVRFLLTLNLLFLKKISKKFWLLALLVLLILLGAGLILSQNIFSSKKDTQPEVNEVNDLISEVGKLVALPEGETPTIATITDIEKIKGQPFFQKAKNGDKVLIYTNAKKAILYDPNAKKIIDVAPINIGSPSGQTTSPAP